MSSTDPQILKIHINGEGRLSTTENLFDVWNPSTGDLLAKAPLCTAAEVDAAVEAAHAAFPAWSNTPVMKRVQVLYRFRDLIDQNLEELTRMVCTENGKVWSEAEGDVLKAKEAVELACGAPTMMMGEGLMNVSTGYDTTLYREPLGVFVGISPFNFPAMIPMGWLMPMAIATGNTLVLKPAHMTPMTSMRMMELLYEAGLPKGVVNLVTADAAEAERLTTHPLVKGVAFIGSTVVGRKVFATAAGAGKRVQVMGQAKNHALVLEDAALERTARGIINGAFGCAGERCMALPVVVAQESIADELVALLVKFSKDRKLGPAWDKTTELGPVVTAKHKQSVTTWIEKGVADGATLALDGRNAVVEGYENGFFLGHTIFDHVTPEMSIGNEEVFGPVLFVKRVKDFEEGLAVMNANPFANGSVIFTQNGYYAREFVKRTDAGMVGVNVGIPVPAALFPFAGHKGSFLGDLHVLGKDGMRFFTESKVVTSTWFTEEQKKQTKVDTWDGMLGTK